MARFISPDSIVPSAGDPQSHNRYSYVRNNPVKYTDPTGNSFLSSLFGGIFKAFSFVTKYVLPAFRIAGGVLELMGGGGSLLSSLQSIASGMSSYIKNSQFQFASQVFGFFASAGSPGGATGGETSVGGSPLSESTSVAGGSGGDSGSGEINLGPGSFTYWAKNSAGEYEIHPYPSSQPYYGETTFTFVREVGPAEPKTSRGILFPDIEFGFDSPVGGGKANIPFLNPGQGITGQQRGPSANFPLGPVGVLSVRPDVDATSGTAFVVGSVSTLAGGVSVALNINDGSYHWKWLWPSLNFPVGPGVNF